MEPDAAIVLVVLLALAGIAAQGEIRQYAAVTVIGVMLYGMVWSVALLRLPTKLPEHYAEARFRLSRGTIWLIASAKIVISAGFLYVGIRNNQTPAAIYLLLLLLGGAYYGVRRLQLTRAGVDLAALLREETRAR